MKNVHPFVNTVNSIPLKDNSIDVAYSLGTMVGFVSVKWILISKRYIEY